MIVDGFIINKAKKGVFRAVEVNRQMVQWVTEHMDQFDRVPCYDTNQAKCEGPWKAQCTRSSKVMAKCGKTCGTCGKTSPGLVDPPPGVDPAKQLQVCAICVDETAKDVGT